MSAEVNGQQVRRPGTLPSSVAELLPRARELAERSSVPPSRNRLMRELRIGAPKASALLAHLANSHGEPERATVTELRTARLPKPNDGGPAEPVSAVGPATSVAGRPVRVWPVVLLALPAFVAIWSGWVGLGELAGFGMVHPLPGIWDGLAINSAITLPIGMETYAAFALRVWLSGSVPVRARRFARCSAAAALGLGAAGQMAYHLMSAAPWQITTVVACLPVAVLGMGAALAHLLRTYTESAS